MQRASSTRALGAGTILTAVFVTLVLAVLPGVARADALEDVAVPVDGLTMTFDLDTAAKTATFADVDEPSLATTVTTPSEVAYDGETYMGASSARGRSSTHHGVVGGRTSQGSVRPPTAYQLFGSLGPAHAEAFWHKGHFSYNNQLLSVGIRIPITGLCAALVA